MNDEQDKGYDPYNSADKRMKPAAIPAWLENDPELLALATAITAELPAFKQLDAVEFYDGERYRK